MLALTLPEPQLFVETYVVLQFGFIWPLLSAIHALVFVHLTTPSDLLTMVSVALGSLEIVKLALTPCASSSARLVMVCAVAGLVPSSLVDAVQSQAFT